MRSESCDIFCTVVDNYGDIGVCWRLARQLAHEHGLDVRLWIDDLASFAKLCPQVETSLEQQCCRGVEIRHWGADIPQTVPADLVIEAFACKLPATYIQAMAARARKPVWINLEYLSAEAWVETHHRLPSPHPQLPLTKYFFFPGFTDKTGGLLLERNLLARRDVFQADTQAQHEYWRSLNVPQRQADELRISLFGYENAALESLMRAWESGVQPVTCLLPEGRLLPQVAAYFAQTGGVGDVWQRGNLRVQVLPFVEQERYDLLLWACDINFVRGEDSCVRAQWAGKPFIWHIYPQHDGVHLEKLQAFMGVYCADVAQPAAQALQALWLGWNRDTALGPQMWPDFLACRTVLQAHARTWAQRQSGNNLALNLLDFSRQVA